MAFPISYNTDSLRMPLLERKKQVTISIPKKSKGVMHGYSVKAKLNKN